MAVGWHGGSGKRKRVKEREAERTRRVDEATEGVGGFCAHAGD